VGSRPRLSIEERVEIRRLNYEGLLPHQIARAICRSWWTVESALRPTVPTSERLWEPSPARLSMAVREEIRAVIARDETFTAIAGRIDRAVSTVSREVSNNGGRERYRAVRAHRRAARCARRPKPAKLANHLALRTLVEEWLEELWSPEQIAQRLRHEHPDDPKGATRRSTSPSSSKGVGPSSGNSPSACVVGVFAADLEGTPHCWERSPRWS
jgi:IS30 family transposase